MIKMKNLTLVVFLGLLGFCYSSGRCERIHTHMCANLGYNTTSMPNSMGHQNQKQAILALSAYEPFLTHKCSPYIRLFICSVFMPLCSEHVPGPIAACKGLCHKVRDDCTLALENMGLQWPQELNCTRFPEPPELCMQQPTEENDQIVTGNYINPEDILFKLKRPYYNFKSKCVSFGKHKKPFQKQEIETFEVWVAVWSIICLVFTIFALLTFLIQPRRFRWPARPILYLISCGFITSTIYLIRWVEGPYTCKDDSTLEKPSESLSCVAISLILLFCDIAYSLWWCVFCFVWFLSASKEWSTEAIEKISTRLHTSVWILSAFPMLTILISNNININDLSGFCEVRNMPLIMFQLVFIVISIFLSIVTTMALKNVRRTLLQAGRPPLKLERLFYRLLIISFGICLPHLLYLLSQFYDSFEFALVKLVLRNTSIIFSTLWVYSPKTFKTWNSLLMRPFRKSETISQANIITEKKKKTFFWSLFPKIFKLRNSNNNLPATNAPLMPVTKV